MKFIIIEEQEIAKNGLVCFLRENYNIRKIVTSINLPELLQFVSSEKWDIAILEIKFRERDGIDLLCQLHQAAPELPILVYTVCRPDQYAVRVLRAGAMGFLSKDGTLDDLQTAIEAVLAGNKYISKEIIHHVLTALEEKNSKNHRDLSDREFYVFQKLADGHSVSEIAVHLNLSVKTISHYRRRILDKMNLRNNSDIMKYALNNLLIDNDG